jgi:acyl-CoA reductase-like NAD-dependent aldehyde dehydrogenase
MSEYQLFINGEYTPALSGKTADSLNPATGEIFAVVHQAGVADAQQALDAAQTSFKVWSQTSAAAREAVMMKAADVMASRQQELMDVLIDEAGSTMLKAGYEASHTPDFIRAMAGEARRVTGETYESNLPGVFSYSIRQPLGVVVAISPFNFPLLLAVRKIGWALAAGNSVILKPSEVTPVVGLKLAEIFHEAGLPAGVLNVIPSTGGDLGDTLIADKRVKLVTFTGSTKVGTLIAVEAAKNHTKCVLEMGGKNPLILLDDADLDYAVNTATFSNFFHQGQVCMTASRVIAEQGIYDQFCEKFAAKVATLKVGNPRDPEVLVGPLIRPAQPQFVKEQLDRAVGEGARVLTGGSFVNSFFEPTVLADVTQQMSIFRTECFAPVASVIKATDHEDALAIANDSDYGLSSAVITNDLQKAMLISRGIESGMCHINGPTIRDEAVVPFGGIKNSGLGREGGRYAMEEVTEVKWVTVQQGQQQYPF